MIVQNLVWTVGKMSKHILIAPDLRILKKKRLDLDFQKTDLRTPTLLMKWHCNLSRLDIYSLIQMPDTPAGYENCSCAAIRSGGRGKSKLC